MEDLVHTLSKWGNHIEFFCNIGTIFGDMENILTVIINMTNVYLLPVATKLGQGNIFTSVCQEFCPQGGV